MKVVVTGASGYMGKYVVKELLNRGHEVTAVDLHYKEVDSRAKLSDVLLFSGDKDIFEQLERPELCIHLAWQDGFIHNSPKHMENLSDHFTFLNHMMQGGCKNISVMGTMHEVGYWEGAIDEHTPCNPISMYGIAKDALRRSTNLLAEAENVCWQWLRAYYIYGDDERNHSIFTKICAAAKAGQKTFPFNTGKNKYDFITVDELARQISACVMQREVAGIINCCSGEPISLADKVESFIKEHGFDIKLDYGAFPDRAYDSPAVWGDAEKIQKILQNIN